MANYESKNTVEAKDQISFHVAFEGKPDGSPRIMFIGNSITRHEPAPHIGWCHDHGMAASKKENDYVHRVIGAVQEKYPDAAFCIVQAAIWEMNYTSCNYDDYFALAPGFHPDFVLTAISANIKSEAFEHDTFIREMGKLHAYLTDGNGAKMIQASSFFNNEIKTAAIRDYVEKIGGDFVFISDIPEDESNLAIGQYEHYGVQHHPGDKGMECIANRMLEKLFIYI